MILFSFVFQQLEIAELNAKQRILVAKIKSEGNAESEKIKIEANTYCIAKRAETAKNVAENKAQAVALNAEAEKIAAAQLEARRTYEQRMRSLQSLRALSSNQNVTIAGSSNDNIVAQLCAVHRAATNIGLNMNIGAQ